MDKKEVTEKDLENVAGGSGSNFYYVCTSCQKKYEQSGNCPVCGKKLLSKPKGIIH